jgi:hypothetical protein
MRTGSETTGNIQQNSTGYLGLAVGNTVQRPGSPVNGMLRYNSDTQKLEAYTASAWANVGAITGAVASVVAGSEGIVVTTANGVASVGLNILSLATQTTTSFSDYMPLNNGTSNYKITSTNFANFLVTAASGTYVAKAGDTMAGSLAFPAGSAAAPSITFSGDTNTGIFHNSADTFSLVSNGVAVSTVSPTGLGIGTTTPTYPIDIAGTGQALVRVGTGGDNTVRTTGTGLIFEQTGDIYGTSRLSIMNRTGLNGMIYETTDPTTTVVDFNFKTANLLRNIRFENRSTYAIWAGNPAFHIGGSNPDNPTLAVGDNQVTVANGPLVMNAGAIENILGSATAPSYTFSGDLNTGIYGTGSDVIGLTLGGTSTVLVQSSAAAAALVVNATTAIQYPVGSTAQRPSTPARGMERYNSDYTYFETYDAGSGGWTPVRPFRHPGLAVGRYYGSAADGNTLTTTAFFTGTIYAVPFYLGTNQTIDRVGSEVTTAGAAGSTLRMAIYANLYTSAQSPLGAPGTLISDLGTVTATTAALKEYTISSTLITDNQWFWIAWQCSANMTMRATNSSIGSFFMGRTSTTATGINALTATQTYGAFPGTFTTGYTASTANPPFIWIRNV